ncbi:MAG: hypothetical protein ACRD9L_12480, partial [Bryobacteraceae bacterium]
MVRLLAVCAAMALGLECQAAVSVRLLLGVTDRQSTQWDGSVTTEGGSVTRLEPWRFEGQDDIAGSSWRCSTHKIRLFGQQAGPNAPFMANGVVVTLTGESEQTTLSVRTTQGNFSVRLGDIPYGKAMEALGGRVMVDRAPAASQITNDQEEEDDPAAAAANNGDVWV